MRILLTRFLTVLMAVPVLFTLSGLFVIAVATILNPELAGEGLSELMWFFFVFAMISATPAASVLALISEYHVKREDRPFSPAQQFRLMAILGVPLIALSEAVLFPLLNQFFVPPFLVAFTFSLLNGIAPAFAIAWLVAYPPISRSEQSFYQFSFSTMMLLAVLMAFGLFFLV